MSLNRYAARRDGNEQEVIEALRAVGALVFPLKEADLPDLLVGFKGRWVLVEVKGEAGPKGGTKGRKLKPGQQAFFDTVQTRLLPSYVVRNAREALAAIGIETVATA